MKVTQQTASPPHIDMPLQDKRGIGPFYQQLHTRFTQFKRILHITLLVSALYLLALLVYQFTSLSNSHNATNTALGKAETRYELAQQFSNLLAQQWLAINNFTQQDQKTFLNTWTTQPNVIGISVYSQDGQLLITSPEDFRFGSIVADPDNKLVASSAFSIDEQQAGFVIVVTHEQVFNEQKRQQLSKQIDNLFSAWALGIIAGIYLLRAILKLRLKIRK